MHSVTRTIFLVFAFKVTQRVTLLTRLCKPLTRVATLSGGRGTCLKCISGTAPLGLFAQFSFDLVTVTFDLLALAMSGELNFIHPTHVPIFSILRLSVPELCVTQYDHIITITWNGHCACAVSRDLSPGGKNSPHFCNPWPQFVYSLCHFHGATTKGKPCYRRK